MHKSSLVISPSPAVIITVTVRDEFWAAGLDPCDVAVLWQAVSSSNDASDRRLRRYTVMSWSSNAKKVT